MAARTVEEARILEERSSSLTSITNIGDDDLPLVLCQCIEMVTLKATAQVPNLDFVPVLNTSYADGQRMLTVTCAVSDRNSRDKFPNALFKRWAFASAGWNDMHDIAVPILSAKERFKLDGNLGKTAKKLLTSLRFLPADDESSSLIAISNYKKYQRFYPAFRHVDD